MAQMSRKGLRDGNICRMEAAEWDSPALADWMSDVVGALPLGLVKPTRVRLEELIKRTLLGQVTGLQQANRRWAYSLQCHLGQWS